ncbi:MAG: arginyltransferase [Pseudomonadales bacterium]
MTSLSELRFFATPPHDCSYLEGREATTLVVDPLAKVDTKLYTALSEMGFRRSGNHIYRPYCQACSACIPVRIPVERFEIRRRQRRIWKKNGDLVVSTMLPAMTDEYFHLYRDYIDHRHPDGDMYPADADQFESFLVDGRPEARFYEFRDQEKLLAIAVADELDNGLSAIYTFFDPTVTERSLGVYAILWLIEETGRLGKQYLYLGYWIKDCQKMSYKTDYKPIELFVNNHWVTVIQ